MGREASNLRVRSPGGSRGRLDQGQTGRVKSKRKQLGGTVRTFERRCSRSGMDLKRQREWCDDLGGNRNGPEGFGNELERSLDCRKSMRRV